MAMEGFWMKIQVRSLQVDALEELQFGAVDHYEITFNQISVQAG